MRQPGTGRDLRCHDRLRGELEKLSETPKWIAGKTPAAQYSENGPPMSQPLSIMGTSDERLSKEAAMKYSRLIAMMLCMWITTGYAETGFDPRYERDYNIFNPVTQYQSDNPLNPVNTYDPNNPFNPMNKYDPGNPANPINKYSPNNPFNPVNRYHPENPLNPANKYTSDVPFEPLDGGTGGRR